MKESRCGASRSKTNPWRPKDGNRAFTQPRKSDILFDERCCPNHVDNFCFATVHANTKTGELTYLSSYYYIGHFSKFIRPGARRIATSSSRSQLLATAFLNLNGKVSAVVMNASEKDAAYWLWLGGNAVEVNGPAHSIQ